MMTNEHCRMDELKAGDKYRHDIETQWVTVRSVNVVGRITNLIDDQDDSGRGVFNSQLVYVQRQVKTQQPVCTDEAMRFWEKTYFDLAPGFGATTASEEANRATRAWLKAKQDISEGKL